MKKKPGRRSKTRRKKSSPRKHDFTRGLYGWITHTDLSSHDPAATRAWCAKVLGWRFGPSFPGPGGEYHLFAYSTKGGGGIRKVLPSEEPGSLPHVHVQNASESFAKAIMEGAEAIMPPTRVMEGVTIAVVRAPGGVPIGLSGP
jgi:predicted enzyme related to lactoylglutathione lyase